MLKSSSQIFSVQKAFITYNEHDSDFLSIVNEQSFLNIVRNRAKRMALLGCDNA